MGYVSGIWVAILGILGASGFIISRRPDAKELISQLAPYQGWIGAVSALWGAWRLIDGILNLRVLSLWPMFWITWMAVGAVQLCLGLLLGVGVLKSFIKNDQASQKMDATIQKLTPYQSTLGLVAIGLGIWMIVANVIWAI